MSFTLSITITDILQLLACALGTIARPFDGTPNPSSDLSLNQSDVSIALWEKELNLASLYYGMARKRIGLLDGTIIRAQCFFLSGVFLMYALRPLEAWQNFLQASSTYHVYLRCRASATNGDLNSYNRTRKLEQRLFWSCFKSEWSVEYKSTER